MTKIKNMKNGDIYRLAEIGKISCELLHDIINPITGLALYLDTAKNAGLDLKTLEQFLDPLNTTSSTIRDFIKLIQNNLNEGNTVKIINIENVISDVIHILKCKALNKRVSFIFAKNTLRTLIVGNSMKMYQIVINIISNAIDSFENMTNDRKRQIIIVMEDSELDEKANLLLKISDNGCGIPFNRIQKIFNTFSSTKITGVGLGLRHTKNLIEKDFEGTIIAKSDDRQTEFRITIPFCRRLGYK